MLVPKYITIQLAFFGIVGTGLLVSADISDPRTFSMDFIPRNKILSDMKHRPLSSNNLASISVDLYEHDTQQMLRSIRAGGTSQNTVQRTLQKITHPSTVKQAERQKKAFIAITTTAILYGLFHTRSTWMGLFNKEKLQATVVESLESLNSFPYLYSRSLYTSFMIVWECLGLPTVPVETAAGMVFGWSAIYWSGIGKLLGAALAFGLGRGTLSSFVEKKLAKNEFLGLVQASTEENPLLVVTLMKLSCFPETVKNFGSSILKPIKWWMFLLGTSIHGLTFTSLWTYFGVDAAARLRDTEGLLPPDKRLKMLLTLALFNGAVISPLSMFYWIKTLQEKQEQDTKGKKA